MNFLVGKKFQLSDKKQSQQYHWFASCAIIQKCEFSQYSDVPEGPVRGLDLTHILPSESDIAALKTNYTCHIAKVAKEFFQHCPFLLQLILGLNTQILFKRKMDPFFFLSNL